MSSNLRFQGTNSTIWDFGVEPQSHQLPYKTCNMCAKHLFQVVPAANIVRPDKASARGCQAVVGLLSDPVLDTWTREIKNLILRLSCKGCKEEKMIPVWLRRIDRIWKKNRRPTCNVWYQIYNRQWKQGFSSFSKTKFYRNNDSYGKAEPKKSCKKTPQTKHHNWLVSCKVIGWQFKIDVILWIGPVP